MAVRDRLIPNDVDIVNPKGAVDEFFDRDAPNWQAIYQRADLFSVIHQRRHQIALHWVEGLDLDQRARALEIGCGAGLFAVALAGRGFDVVAGDSASTMLELARRNAERAGVRITLKSIDAHRLDEPPAHYDLVVALGVVPWLHSTEVALAELSRVLRPGGHVILNADNRARLQNLFDPLYAPYLSWARRLLRGGRTRRAGMPSTVMHWPGQFDRLLARAGLLKVRGQTFGFGPFTFLGRRLLAERPSIRLHGRLQQLSDAGWPAVRSTGAQYIVLARRA